MTNKELLKEIEKFEQEKYYDFSNEFLKSISIDEAEFIKSNSRTIQMFKLPKSEIEFFEWLKKNDKKVWDDLWGVIDEEPYLVSLTFLPVVLDDSGRGFPICDLMDNDNYFFTPDHVTDEESKVFIDVAKLKLESRKRMTLKELLILEISTAPIDIWHFSYKYNFKILDVKNQIESLKSDEALVHLKEAEHLVPFIDF